MTRNTITLTDWKGKKYYFTPEQLNAPDYDGQYWKKLVGLDAEENQWTIIIRTTRKDFAAREANLKERLNK